MKVLLHHLTPFALDDQWKAQIQKTRAALEAAGFEVDFLRWYEGAQTGKVLHFFGRMPSILIPFAQQKHMKVVVSESLPATGWPTPLRRALLGVLEKILPWPVRNAVDWDSYRLADACIVASAPEAERLERIFRVPREKIYVVPDGEEGKLKAIYEGLAKTSR